MTLRYWLFAIACLVSLTTEVQADTAQVAVAANFIGAMKALSSAFSESTGHVVIAIPGATSKLVSQIENDAPFDVLLAADATTSHRLDATGKALPSPQFIYAEGVLVLWSQNPKLVDADGRCLRSTEIKHLAIADPALAPYGRAASETIEALGLKDLWQSRLVLGDNIAKTYQFVATGNAELGFVSASEVFKEGELLSGSAWVVPKKLYRPLLQEARLLKHGQNNAAAKAFLSYLQSEPAKKIIRSFGYHVDQKESP